MFKFGKKVVSAVIAYSIVFGSMAFDPAGKKNVVRADATLFDSASAINYATILGGAVDYGIVAGTLEQTSHTETTFATNNFIHTSSNIDVDYVNSTALFLIGRTYTPGSGIERFIRFGRTTASAIYFEAPTPVFGDYNPAIQAGKNVTNGNFRFEGEYTTTPFIAAENANAYKNVDRLIDRICSNKPAEDVEKGWSYFLNDRATNPQYVLNPEGETCPFFTPDGDAHIYIDLTSPQFNEKVVYINISKDSPLRKYLGKSSGLQIKKNESSVVVFNIEDDGKDEPFNLNKPLVTVDGVTYSGVTATNGGDPVGAAAVQKNFNESIIWNVMEKSPRIALRRQLQRLGRNTEQVQHEHRVPFPLLGFEQGQLRTDALCFDKGFYKTICKARKSPAGYFGQHSGRQHIQVLFPGIQGSFQCARRSGDSGRSAEVRICADQCRGYFPRTDLLL